VAVDVARLPIVRDARTIRQIAEGGVKAVDKGAIGQLGVIGVVSLLIVSIAILAGLGHAVPEAFNYSLVAGVGYLTGSAGKTLYDGTRGQNGQP
jgi:threonine/homoserine/homoserine lactone efflux protein